MLDPVPPDTRPGVAVRSTSWLIDHDKSGLWYPTKIDPGAETLPGPVAEFVFPGCTPVRGLG
jgi:hypothetical protein